MKPIQQARADLEAAKARGDDEFSAYLGLALAAGVKLKAMMVDKGLTSAKAKCPKCLGAESLKGRLIVGPAAGRHRRSGGAFRMWCETEGCGLMMME